MKEEVHDGGVERSVVTALIVNTEVLAKLAPRWQKDPFRSKWSNLVGSWCVDHFKKFGEAPKVTIVSIFQTWCQTMHDVDVKKTMERFLSQLSGKYERLNKDIQPKHTVAAATMLFNDVRLERLSEDIAARIKRGDTAGAIEVAEAFRKVTISAPDYIDIFRDKEAQRLALERKQKVLIKYEGGIGEFFGGELCEDAFIAFLAPMKVGKSYNILDVAWEAVRQKRKVAYFQVGDMTRDQIIRRFHKRACLRPIDRGIVRWPTMLVPGVEEGVAQVDHEEVLYDKPMTTKEMQAAYARIVSTHKAQRLRLSVHASKAICSNDIKNILEEWDKDGWHADVCCVDYAENLAPNNAKMNDLMQVEDTWTGLSQIRETRKCLVLTAAQANKQGFNPWVLTKENFSRNKMILAIVTGMVGINQTEEEQTKGLFRLNWIVRREGAWSVYKCCHIASCLDAGQAVVLSAF